VLGAVQTPLDASQLLPFKASTYHHESPTMPLLDLPAELLLQVADCCESITHLNSFVRSSRQLHHALNPYLYRRAVQSNISYRALQWALQCAEKSTIIHLLGANADIHDLDSVGTAFHQLISCNTYEYRYRERSLGKRTKARIEIIRLLVDSGVDINARDGMDRTPLWLATLQRDEHIFWTLVDCGADTATTWNGGMTTLLHTAAMSDCSDNILELLISQGLDINAADSDGSTPLHYAAQRCNVDAIKCLVKNGADIHARTKGGHTPLLSFVAKVCRRGPQGSKSAPTFRALFECGAQIEAKDDHGETALHLAARLVWHPEMAELLVVEFGADVSARNSGGWTPLHRASAAQVYVLIPLLLRHGADIHARTNKGETALHTSILSYTQPMTIQLLVDNGADIHAQDGNGKSVAQHLSDFGLHLPPYKKNSRGELVFAR
jgi:ankyrin repeat protein